jgi:hypothetical protein
MIFAGFRNSFRSVLRQDQLAGWEQVVFADVARWTLTTNMSEAGIWTIPATHNASCPTIIHTAKAVLHPTYVAKLILTPDLRVKVEGDSHKETPGYQNPTVHLIPLS